MSRIMTLLSRYPATSLICINLSMMLNVARLDYPIIVSRLQRRAWWQQCWKACHWMHHELSYIIILSSICTSVVLLPLRINRHILFIGGFVTSVNYAISMGLIISGLYVGYWVCVFAREKTEFNDRNKDIDDHWYRSGLWCHLVRGCSKSSRE